MQVDSERERTAQRLLPIVLSAAVFGVAMSVLKGTDTGIRDDVDNLSAPWLLLPFFAGAAGRGRGPAGRRRDLPPHPQR